MTRVALLCDFLIALVPHDDSGLEALRRAAGLDTKRIEADRLTF